MMHSSNQRSQNLAAADYQTQTNRTYTSHSAVQYQVPTGVNATSITAGAQTLMSDATPAREQIVGLTSATNTNIGMTSALKRETGASVGAAVISRVN